MQDHILTVGYQNSYQVKLTLLKEGCYKLSNKNKIILYFADNIGSLNNGQDCRCKLSEEIPHINKHEIEM